jgi:hypothetical protein
MVKVTRPPFLAPHVVLLDGISGTGKTLMGPVLGSFDRIQLGRFEYNLEYNCILDYLRKTERDASVTMLKMLTDLSLYNTMIARESNFRPADLSGVFSNPKKVEYLKRLFTKDGKFTEEKIKTEKPIAHFITHQILIATDALFEALQDRLTIVEMERHPAYLVDHWLTYVDRFGVDPRDFTLWIESQNKALPWFTMGWENKFLTSNSLERVILLLEFFWSGAQKKEKEFNSKIPGTVLSISFEKFVLNPEPYLDAISKRLQASTTKDTLATLKAQNCPRKIVTDGPNKSIYRRYAWTPPSKSDNSFNDEKDLNKRVEVVANKLNSEFKEKWKTLCSEYEKKYGLWF